MRSLLASLSVIALLSACKVEVNAPDDQQNGGSPKAVGSASRAVASNVDAFAAHDPEEGQPLPRATADDVPRPVMQAQVVLDRLGFTPGVVDGREGASTANALRGFQEANSLPTAAR